jgi:predicted dehydrogenase
MEKIRFGMTGSGYMARTHAEAIRRLGPRASLVALWGGSRAAALAGEYGAACEESAASLARRRDIDAIVITTPHHLHAGEAMLALENGKHILVEKPLATTVEDCDRMIAAAAARGLVVATAYNERFRSMPMKARELIASGAIGRVQSMHGQMIADFGEFEKQDFGGNKSWLNLPENVGFVIDGLPHLVDTMSYVTGLSITAAAGFSRSFLPRPVEDTTVGILEFSDGVVASVNTTAAAAGDYPLYVTRYSIIGSAGLIDLDPFGELHLSDRKNGWRLIDRQPPIGFGSATTAFGDVRMQCFVRQMESFIDGMEGRPMEAGSGRDGRVGLAACLAMLTSTRERRLIELGPAPAAARSP